MLIMKKMSSLREEIECYIRRTDAWELADTLACGITEIVEKRIDDEINKRETDVKWWNDYVKTIPVGVGSGLFDAQLYLLKELKKEMRC